MPTCVTITFEGNKCCVTPDPVPIQSNGVIQWSCQQEKFKVTKLVDKSNGNPACPFGDNFPDPGAGFRNQVTTPAANQVTQTKKYKYTLEFENEDELDPIIIINP